MRCLSRTTFGGRAISTGIVLLGLTFALSSVAQIHDSTANRALVVHYSASVVPPGAVLLPLTQIEQLDRVLGGGFRVAGRTRDGAFRLQFDHPLAPESLRAMVNQIRLDPKVLYANIEMAADATADTILSNAALSPTVDRLLVKYRANAAGLGGHTTKALGAAEVARLSTLAEQPLAWTRITHDGAQVMQMLRRLPTVEGATLAATLAQQPDIEYAEPDARWTVQIEPTDPCYAIAGTDCASNFQWNLFDPVGGINMPAAWDISTGSGNINIAVVDTGALFDHPDLAGRFLPGYDLISNVAVANDGDLRDADASDPGDWITSAESSSATYLRCPISNSSWHGTHVSGIIGAAPNNDLGTAGINWTSGLVPVRVLGKCGGYAADVNDGIVWAAGGTVTGLPVNANPARVINLSTGGVGFCPYSTQIAINKALELGAVVVVAAGNRNLNASLYSPANCSGVITVAASTKAGSRGPYSNYGTAVEIAAPGGDATNGILSTLNNSLTAPDPAGYLYANNFGTSMAAAHVAGVASLVLSVNPVLTPAQVLVKLQGTARRFPSGSTCTVALCGAGMLDAGAAVAAASVTPVDTTTTLASSNNPAPALTNVILTATVTGNAPTGKIAFRKYGFPLAGCGAVDLVDDGSTQIAQCTVIRLAIGTHPITATYSGDMANIASTSSVLSQVVEGFATTTTLAASLNPSTYGAIVWLTATVTGNAPTGAVAFTDNGRPMYGCFSVALSGTGVTKTARCSIYTLGTGPHTVVAKYNGNTVNLGSTSAELTQTVDPATTLTVMRSGTNPALAGAKVLYIASVAGKSPTGTVTFTDNGEPIITCAAVGLTGLGNARSAACSAIIATPGNHLIVGSYNGNSNNLTSSGAVAEVIN